jgi:hypothetical protein
MAFAKARALGLRKADPSLSEEAAAIMAAEVYDENDNVKPTQLDEPLDADALGILQTYAVNNELPEVGTFGSQNDFLASVFPISGPLMFAGSMVMRKATPMADKPGYANVTLSAVLYEPRAGRTELSQSFIVNVCGKRRARRVEPRAAGALLRKIAYKSNAVGRSFSHILKCLGPKPNHNFV